MLYYLTPVCVGILLYILQRRSEKSPTVVSENVFEYRSGRLIFIIGLIMCCIGLLPITLGISFWIDTGFTGVVAMTFLMGFIFIALGMPNVLSGLFYKIKVTDEGISQQTILNKIKFLSWNELNSVSFYKTNQDLILHGEKMKIRCNRYLKGFPHLVEQIESKAGRSIKQLSLAKKL